jgi:hypothetical protein
LPLAAKCGLLEPRASVNSGHVFVGIYAHHKAMGEHEQRPGSKEPRVKAKASIKLQEAANFQEVSQSWVANLYDTFLDLRQLEIEHQQKYPEGEQYIYNVQLRTLEEDAINVRLYRDRMTLVEVENSAGGSSVTLEFSKGPAVSHVLSASKPPKTVFDFDQVHAVDGSTAEILSSEPTVWCALFGAVDGELTLTARAVGDHRGLPPIGSALLVMIAMVCGLMLLAVVFGGVRSVGERLGVDPNAPVSDRLSALVRMSSAQHESTLSLTRVGSMQGYVGSDVIDRSVEDQYLHRGGIGDDGI